MSTAVATINGWSETWSDLVLAILWQSTLLALFFAVVASAMRRTSPGLRYWLWQIVTVKLLLMPFWTWAVPLADWPRAEPAVAVVGGPGIESPPVGLERAALSAAASSPAALGVHPAEPVRWDEHVRDITWRSWLWMIWVATVSEQIVRLVRQRIRLARLLRRAEPVDGRLAERVARTAERLGMRRPPRAVLIGIECSPFVCGIRRPQLVLPRGLTDLLDETQLGQVLLHELAHVKRHDLLWSWLSELTRILYFFHPVVYWINDRIRLERELCCDQMVMAASGASAADYADTLVKVVSHASQPAVLKAAAVSKVGLDGQGSRQKRNRETQ